ncbi:MAG: MBL fold metallo-hydrolase [Dehalococcoidia bacterium]|nr:MBL fold metallo-hydrolase [Dehalococcoidia bacterium]MCB9485017.1 MBL fold metallo-hydrolase [Thermoflexaceae bacterium]
MPPSLEPRLLTNIGDFELFLVPEVAIPTSVRWFLGNMPPETIDAARKALDPVFFDENGRLIQSVHTYVLRSPGRVILIDTGVGNQKPRGGGIPAFDMLDTPFLDRLAAIGVQPNDVDLVLCTHMHVDHLGWDARLENGDWVPTFPRARHLFVQREWDAFIANAESDPTGGNAAIRHDTIDPLTRANLVDLVPADHQVVPGIRFEPSHGHTPGHVNIVVESRGTKAVFIGDVMHTPIQVLVPDGESPLNGPPAATVARKEVISRYAGTETLVFGAHFAAPCGGHIRSTATGYNFVPMATA